MNRPLRDASTCSLLLLAGWLASGWPVLATAASAAAATSANGTTHLSLAAARDTGWQEAVISTRSLGALEEFFTTVAGYRVLWRGLSDASVSRYYQLPDRQYREVLLGDAAGTPGLVRLVEFGAAAAITIRAAAQPWDTGGILSLMTRSNDTQAVWQAAQALGWSAFNEPVDFDFGAVRLRNIILRGPDGVNVSVYERLEPRMPNDADLRKLRRPFNSMQSVKDLDRTRAFYIDTLGFELINSGKYLNPSHEPNNFGMPANIVAENPIDFAIVAPVKDSATTVETVQLIGAEGRAVDAVAVPPNRGIVSLRYPVSSLDRVLARLSAHQIAPYIAPRTLVLRPYGRVRSLAVRSPDGAVLEFFETLDRET
ncbi:MAG: hypothetical protein KDI32_03855 [Pseudomonadales bacterium]|nr:hypothetical protein [Pseudomonadales bacterium]